MKCPFPTWVRRVFAAGFLFFLVKGLVWLAIAAGAVMAAW